MDPRYSIRSDQQVQPDASLNYYAQSLAFTLNKLRHVFDPKGKLESNRVAAYECLAELSKIMRVLLNKYSLSKSKELLIDSQSLIVAVKQYNYDSYSGECHGNVVDAINKLYTSFHASISNYVMEDNVTVTPAPSAPPSSSSAETTMKSPSSGQFVGTTEQKVQTPRLNHHEIPEERLLAHHDGMSLALEQAKVWSKYAKDLICYLEKRTQIEIDYHRSIVKNAQNLKTSLSDESFLPFQDIYVKFSGHEMENGNISLSNFDLLTQHFLTPLNEHRIEFDKKMKKIKEYWVREKKQMNETQNNFVKSRDLYINKNGELKKLKTAFKSSESNSEWSANDQQKIEKKRRTIEEATIREKEAHENYKKSIFAVHSQKAHMDKTQRDLILKTKDLLSILEMKIKEVTSHYFETLKDSMTYSPAQISKSIDDTGKYEFGKSYRDYANTLPPLSSHMQQSNNHYGGSNFKVEPDSSESDTNNHSSLAPTSTQLKQMAIKDRNLDFDIENEMSALTREFKTCIDNFNNELDYNNHNEKRKQRLFGVSLTSLSSSSVPEIVRQCVEEIELNGAQINGIYRVSGVKSKVESLCHSFETNPDGVDLSDLSPNIIANVLKHFFRELPDPLMTFQLYPDFIKVATKYASNHTVENGEDIVSSLKKVVARMPLVHYNTLKYLMRHLRTISHNCAINNMPPSNLGIIFGPTLLRRNNEASAISSTLFDATHQGRVVELLIIYANEVFDISDEDEEDNTLQTTSQNSFDPDEMIHVKEKERGSSFSKSSPKLTHSSSGGENSFRIYKSATCSSIVPQSNQSKANIVEARRQFFTSAFHGSSQNPFNKYKPFLVASSSSSSSNAPSIGPKSYLNQAEDGLSPFSQIAASSSTPSQYKIKRLTQSNYHPQVEKPSKMYQKNNELSKSATNISNYSKNSLTVASFDQDNEV